MDKSLYVFMSCSGEIIPQCLDQEEAGTVLSSMLKQKAIILPITCTAISSEEALSIYRNKVKDNMEIFELFTNKESAHVC